MLFNAYSESTEGLLGISTRSAGHIFAKEGRRISRPQGRADWLLFYVAAGDEHFLSPAPQTLFEGGFVLFRPGQPQIHVQKDCDISGTQLSLPQAWTCLYLHLSKLGADSSIRSSLIVASYRPPNGQIRSSSCRGGL